VKEVVSMLTEENQQIDERIEEIKQEFQREKLSIG